MIHSGVYSNLSTLEEEKTAIERLTFRVNEEVYLSNFKLTSKPVLSFSKTASAS